ncbi:condensation domain-containing protein [Gordonia sp. CPCC 205333]|uniref:condensation domain-containing protein n=1 Tax=Gordonia sp. CPCC 205333 TaxID=3140790 RepID=UPI003AF3F2B3
MRIAAASDWRPRPGTLIDWVPTPETVAAASTAPTHAVGPSFLQRDHINTVVAERAAGTEHRAFTCVTVPVAEPLDVERMTFALNGFLRDHEGWRSTFDTAGDDIVRRVVDATNITVVPLIAEGSDAATHLTRRLPTAAVFDAFPAVAFGVVSREDSFDLYFAIDHAFGDASSQAIGLAEILARYHRPAEQPWATGTPASHLEHTAAEFARAATLTVDTPSVQQWREILQRNSNGLPDFPLDLGIVDGQPQPVHIDLHQLADAPSTEQLSVAARGAGTGFSALIFAALAVTERRLAGRDHYTTATVLSTRSGAHLGAQGWYINFVPVSFPIRGQKLSDVVADAATGFATARSMAGDPVHGALGALIMAGELDPSVITNPQMVSYLDFRWFPAAEELRDAIIFTGEGVTDHASIWVSRTESGLFAGSQRPDNPIAAEAISRYFGTFREVLAEHLDDASVAAEALEATA